MFEKHSVLSANSQGGELESLGATWALINYIPKF